MKRARTAADIPCICAAWILAVIITLTPPLIASAHAAFITEQDLTPIYSANPPFDDDTAITINWLTPKITIFRSDLLKINTAAKEAALFALPGTTQTGFLGNGPVQQITLPTNPTVLVFFVDSVDFCGVLNPNIIGCASGIPGVVGAPPHSFVVESTAAAGEEGAQLEAHELGHILGLVHCPTNCPASTGNDADNNPIYPNLMDPIIRGSTDLTAAQAAIILGNISGLVQVDAHGRNFIDLQAVVFAVPEPGTFVIVGVGVIVFLLMYGRRRWRSAI